MIDLEDTKKARTVLEANVAYHNLIASEYEIDASSAIIFSSATQQRLHNIASWLGDNTDGGLWVDIGCGTGNMLRSANKFFSMSVGFDISREMLRIAQGRFIDICLSDAAFLPIQSKSASVVSAISVIHHIYDLESVLSEIYRVLKPGGYLYSDLDPNNDCLFLNPLLHRYVRWVYRKILFFVKRLSDLREINPESIVPLQDLAEYHQHNNLFTPGFVSTIARKIGFSKVDVFLSFGALNPEMGEKK